MTKTAQDFEMWAGETKVLSASITDGNGCPQAMTGASIIWQLEEFPGSGSLIKKDTSGSAITISGSVISINLDSLDSESLNGIYYHEARATDTLSRISVLFVGNAKINKSGV